MRTRPPHSGRLNRVAMSGSAVGETCENGRSSGSSSIDSSARLRFVSRLSLEFDIFVREHAQSVRRYAFSMLHDSWAADDALQETFLRAWRFWSSFRGESTREAWVIRICRNVVLDMLKRRFDQPLSRVEQIAGEGASHFDQPMLSLDSTWMLMQLRLEYREVVFLVDVLGYDYETAAVVLDAPVGTVRSRVHRARSALRDVLQQCREETA